jgi:hypothetical protein
MTESCVGSARTGRPRSNMHCLTMLMMGSIADNMAMPPAVRERHEKPRATKFREVVEERAFYGQPHSELVREAYRVCRFRLRSVVAATSQGSLLTRRWRKADSNSRSHLRGQWQNRKRTLCAGCLGAGKGEVGARGHVPSGWIRKPLQGVNPR